MTRGEAALLAEIRSLREDSVAGFREVAAVLGRIETAIVNLATDFRLHVADGHNHGDPL